MHLRGLVLEDIAAELGMGPCALPISRDDEHIEVGNDLSRVSGSAHGLSPKSTWISSYCIPNTV